MGRAATFNVVTEVASRFSPRVRERARALFPFSLFSSYPSRMPQPTFALYGRVSSQRTCVFFQDALLKHGAVISHGERVEEKRARLQ